MAIRPAACAAAVVSLGIIGGCSSPFDAPSDLSRSVIRSIPPDSEARPRSVYRTESDAEDESVPALTSLATPDDYIRYALYHSASIEAAYQRWLAATERLPQVGALPDPRLNFGFFLDEVETRTGPQKARMGVSQSFPWPGLLEAREDAAALAARAEWRRLESEQLAVTERVVVTLHELAYLDAAVRIAQENLDLLRSFEEVVRARYRVGAGSHPELVRVQVELAQLEDRLTQLRVMRPAQVAELNAALNRPSDTDVPALEELPGRVVSMKDVELVEIARTSNPRLLAMDEQIEGLRIRSEIARLQGLPDFMVGLDYIVAGEAMNPSIAESGDDPILLNFGLSLPLWREKYDAGVREAVAHRLAASHERADEANRITAEIQRTWFEHSDADRRVRLYEKTLIPKAEESLRASFASFRAGETSFLDLLDTERTLLEFALAQERARADRGQALARLNTLVGTRMPTRPANDAETPSEEQEVNP